MAITWVDEAGEEVRDRHVLCRADLNVPMDADGHITDDSRIHAALPTIKYLMAQNAKVMLISHLGRPKGKVRNSMSLEPVALRLRDLLSVEVIFVHDCVGSGVNRLVSEQKPDQLVLLENLRFHPGEEKNDPVFAKQLAKNADVYVDDAFGAIHRAHASIVGVPALVKRSYGGLLVRREIKELSHLLSNPKRPFVVMIGGAKVSSKIGALIRLLPKTDSILIGGLMAYTFLYAMGQSVGQTFVEHDKVSLAKNFLKKAQELSVSVYLPLDHVVTSLSDPSLPARTILSGHFSDDDVGKDIGPKTCEQFAQIIEGAQTVFWNGPMGLFEQPQFAHGTLAMADALASSKAYSIVGGGDSAAALLQNNKTQAINFISTGGGASLEFLEGRNLPGLLALGYAG